MGQGAGVRATGSRMGKGRRRGGVRGPGYPGLGAKGVEWEI